MKHFILNQHFKLCWLSHCKTGTPHRIKKTQFPMSLGSYTSYIDHKKLLVVEILCPCWVFPQYTQLQLSCFYTHYPLISKWILMACLWSSIQFPTFSLHWSLPVLCPSQCTHSSTSGLSLHEQLARKAEIHSSTEDQAWLSCPYSAGTLRPESEMERTPEVPACIRDEALFRCARPSGVPRGPVE